MKLNPFQTNSKSTKNVLSSNKTDVFLFIFLAIASISLFLFDPEQTQNTNGNRMNDASVFGVSEEFNDETSIQLASGVVENDITFIDTENLDDKTLYSVTKIIDGDTIKVSDESEEFTVRLIGIDTPETKHPNKDVECFGIEATNKMIELVSNQKVYLMSDDSQDNADRYGRLLRYVILENGLFLNYEMVSKGFAYEYTYRVPYIFQKEFVNAEQLAAELNIGLWSSVC